jgi:tetratricopeptide (TPR) repeat protein
MARQLAPREPQALQDASPEKAQHWSALPLWRAYRSLLDLLEGGDCEAAAARLRDLRVPESSSTATEVMRRLVAVRLALKQSLAREDLPERAMVVAEAPWLMAEWDFVKGLECFHAGAFAKGATYFARAELSFDRLGMHSRAFLASYNAQIGRTYASETQAHDTELRAMTSLQGRAKEALAEAGPDSANIRKVLAMIHRQKAAIFETASTSESPRLNAALNELDRAIEIFEIDGPRSDYHLTLLHAADLSLDLGDEKAARTYFEYVLPPLDTRVEFPHAFLVWRLRGRTEEPLDLDSFTLVPPVWKERYEGLRSKALATARPAFTWDPMSGRLLGPSSNQRWTLRGASLEGALVRLLTKGSASKARLIETLWPESSELETLDHRLHQLVSRLNRKIPGLVIFDGHHYRLSAPVEMSSC